MLLMYKLISKTETNRWEDNFYKRNVVEKETILTIKNVTKKYGPIRAVNDVSFSIYPGKITGLLGPNGAGKTTMINMVLGILDATSGTIEIFSKDVKKHRDEISKKFNFAAVYAHVPPNLTVRQSLYIFGLLYEVQDLNKKIESLLDDFDLRQFSGTKTGLLSSGELSRLNLAKAVINDPCLLLLDEPTASLDPNIAQDIRSYVLKYVKNTNAAVLWTSHNMQEIEAVCDEVMFLSHGKILLSGNPKILPQQHGKKDLEELFIAVAREPLIFETE
jgi:ABC-2 type transport system ATP-binding protein